MTLELIFLIGPIIFDHGNMISYTLNSENISFIPIWVKKRPHDFMHVQLIFLLEHIHHVLGIRPGVTTKGSNYHREFLYLLLQASTQDVHLQILLYNLDQHGNVTWIPW